MEVIVNIISYFFIVIATTLLYSDHHQCLMNNQMESSQQRQTRLQDISAHKEICSQLESLEKRAVIYNFILYSCDFYEGRQHFITLLVVVLNFAF